VIPFVAQESTWVANHDHLRAGSPGWAKLCGFALHRKLAGMAIGHYTRRRVFRDLNLARADAVYGNC